jgi:hypothetical protein
MLKIHVMKFKTGQSVMINPGQIDEDTGTDIGGWCGRVRGFDGALLEIELDSLTLQNLPAAYVINSIDGGYDYFAYIVEPKDVSAVSPRDEPEDVKAMRDKVMTHYEAYEITGIVPPPFPGSAQPKPGKVKPVRDFRQALLAILQSVKGSGAFAASGEFDFVPPGLVIEGPGEIGLPVTPLQAQALIKEARRAPFGKGSRTITDTTVRSAWEIDAARVSFANPAWEKLMQQILDSVKTELGLEKDRIGASLYKLLVYESGDFFLPHKDSEKEAGMFGTLVVGLPGAHTGGVLSVRFDGREKRMDFAEPSSSYRIPFVAFYADCEHEIEPVTSGYRVCLVYNLVHQSKSARIRTPQFSAQVAEIAQLLENAEAGFDEFPSAVLLGHQYTPANFSLSQLKLDDRPRAEALLAAADKAGYFAKLGLVTHYRMGELESDFYYDNYHRGRYYDDKDDEGGGGTMGEIYEEYSTIEHWAEDDDRPGLGNFSVRDNNIIGDIELGEGEPDEQEEEGYTGNAGMTIEYWYHYGAVFLWPQRIHGNVLAQLDTNAKLQWLDFYARRWDAPRLEAEKHVKTVLQQMGQPLPERDERTYRTIDYSPVAAALAQLQDEKFLRKTGLPILARVFSHIEPKQWAGLMKRYDPALFHPAFQETAGSENHEVWHHLLEVLVELDGMGFTEFVSGQIEALPPLLKKAGFYKASSRNESFYAQVGLENPRKAALNIIVKNLLALSHYHDPDAQWREQALDAIFGVPFRGYVNDVLLSILLAGDYRSNPLAGDLRRACREDLQKRTAAEPAPPLDWKRETPSDKIYKPVWDTLRPFLSSPTQRVFDYRAPEAARKQMEYAIRSATIDLQTETISLGRPYTLRLTKTLAAFERAMAEWKEDVQLLEKMGK